MEQNKSHFIMKKSLKILLNVMLFTSLFSLQSQEKTTFFRINAEIPLQNSVDLSGLSGYLSEDWTLEGLKEGDSNVIKAYPTVYDSKSESNKDRAPKFSVEYSRLNKDFDFSQSFQKYNFLIGTSQNNVKTKTKSSYFRSQSINDFICSGCNWLTTDFGFGMGGSFETKNQDLYFGIPFYLKDYKDLLIVPKITERKHEWTFKDTIMSFATGSYDNIRTTELGRFVNYSISGSSFNILSIEAEAKMLYKGFTLEKELNEKYNLILEYSISDKSKGSYTFLDFNSEGYTLTYTPSGSSTNLSSSTFDFTKGSYNVSGTKTVLGFKYNYNSKTDFYFTKYQDTFETSFSPRFILYNSSATIGNLSGTVNEVNSQEFLADFMVWNKKSKMTIDDYRFGVSYKL